LVYDREAGNVQLDAVDPRWGRAFQPLQLTVAGGFTYKVSVNYFDPGRYLTLLSVEEPMSTQAQSTGSGMAAAGGAPALTSEEAQKRMIGLVRGALDDTAISESLIPGIKRLAESNDPSGQCLLAYAYVLGEGVAMNPELALHWFRKAAEQDYEAGQLNLGHAYEDGYGTTMNKSLAVHWYSKAANQGNVDAMTSLGLMYIQGEGIRQDYAKACQLLTRAAEMGRDVAQYNLALMYINSCGVSRNMDEAIKWTKKAAAQGYALAQMNMGVFYANGDGALQDDVEAYAWAIIAARSGERTLLESLEGLDSYSAVRREAQSRAKKILQDLARKEQKRD